MIQFLKPRKDRQRHLDVVESVPMPLPDVIDWLTVAAEESGLTDEEAAEIQVAFQQQSVTDSVESDEFSQDFGLTSTLAVVPDSLDLSQIELAEPLLELTPLRNWSDLARSASVSPMLSIVDSPIRLPTMSEPTVLEPTLVMLTLAEPSAELSPSQLPVALVDADALVEIRLDTCAVAALPETIGLPMLAAATTPAESVDLAIDAAPVAAMIAGVPEAEAANPINWQNDNWASEAVDQAEVVAVTADVTTPDPLSFFQYYPAEDAIGEAQAATDAMPAPYVTPSRQPSMPGGLIGAGVLGATLVSGFVIADTVKTPQVTAVKRPSPPLQSLSPKNQAIAATPPKVMPPESMQPEVALPKPKSATMLQPIFPPLAPIAQSSYATAPFGTPIARSASSDLPQSNAGNGLSESPSLAARRVELSPVAAGPVGNRAPLRDLTQTPELPAPAIPRTPVEPVRATLPTPPMPPTSELPISELPPSELPPSELPELLPDVNVPPSAPTTQPEAVRPEAVRPETSPAMESTAPPPLSRVTPAVLTELTPNPISSPLQPIDAVNPAPIAPSVDVVVPPPLTSTPELPPERVFTREAATAAPIALPPVALAQPIADRTSRLPTQTQLQTHLQNLLVRPTVNTAMPMVAQWRPLTQTEAAVAANAQKLAGFTRQQLSQQDYRAAYQLVGQPANMLPSFGFIDFQRQLIILPTASTTASMSIAPSQSAKGTTIVAQRTMEL